MVFETVQTPLLFIIASGQKKKKKESTETFGPVSAGFTVDESVGSVWQFPQNFDYDSDRRVIVASTRGQHQCSKVPIPELEVILKTATSSLFCSSFLLEKGCLKTRRARF